MLNVADILTSSDKFPDRINSLELTADLLANAAALARKVTALFNDLAAQQDFTVEKLIVTSGFRPQKINEETPGAAKKSLHMACKACDLSDPEGKIAAAIEKAPWLLIEHDLWLENPRFTKGWCHLDSGDRPKRLVRIFNP
jgi:hypothetical protein